MVIDNLTVVDVSFFFFGGGGILCFAKGFCVWLWVGFLFIQGLM